jgi:uncharacterized membrane protein YkoI
MPITRLLFTLILFSISSLSFASENDVQLPLSKQSAAEIVQKKSQGKILSVDKKETAEKTFYLIKVLHNDGEIKVHSLDVLTGLPPEPTQD